MMNLSTILVLALYIFTAGIGIASLLGLLGRMWWRLELFSHFRVQYAVLAGMSSLGLLLERQLPGFLCSLGILIFNLFLIFPLYRPMKPHQQPASVYRIQTANILGSNGWYGQLTRMLEQTNPDLVLLVEYRHHHHQGLHTILQTYPYACFWPQDDNYGLALLSRLPLDSSKVIYMNEDKVPVIVAKLTLDDHPVTIIGSHPPPPKSQELTDMRDRQILALAGYAAEQAGEVILLGDMNTTPWSYIFHDLLREGKLCDSSRGFGVQPTWPDHLPLMRIPIDHILHTSAIQILSHRTGPFGGSDHRPVIVDFYMKKDTHP